jgi:hypothetical protein
MATILFDSRLSSGYLEVAHELFENSGSRLLE